MKERVIVIGGGNVAVDVARTALRLGAKSVEMVCLEQRQEMPALKKSKRLWRRASQSKMAGGRDVFWEMARSAVSS